MKLIIFQFPLYSAPFSMSRQAAVLFSRLRYSHPISKLLPYFHQLHEAIVNSSPGGPSPHNLAQTYDAPPTLERSGSERREGAVTSSRP